ncbi:MAG: phage baseplate assembly protein V [Pseudomonas sp.]|uniref:phage baseplate assembly protein V n=1 Tax=Pseudomonas sp. TaxID=306 RepID=UPI0033908C3B
MNPADQNRRLESLIRHGTIAEVNPGAARCRVKSGGLLTDWLLWFTPAAGEDTEWRVPSIGEQAVALCPSGDPGVGFVLVGFFSDQFPAPDDSTTNRARHYRDGAVVAYDSATSTLTATLPDGGKAAIIAPGGISVVGDVTITGTVTVSDDVIAAGISLVNHRHLGVTPGNGTTGQPI